MKQVKTLADFIAKAMELPEDARKRYIVHITYWMKAGENDLEEYEELYRLYRKQYLQDDNE